MKIVVYGPPCSGKTTVSLAIAHQFPSITRLSFRAMCQIARDNQTPEGLQWSELERARSPFPPGLTDRIALPSLKMVQHFVIEGYPKTLYEVECFFKDLGRPSHLLIVQEDEVEILRRAQHRLECQSCLRTFTRRDGRCPVCRIEGRTRAEDSPQHIRQRLAEYRAKSALALPRLREITDCCIEGSSENLCARTTHFPVFVVMPEGRLKPRASSGPVDA